MLCCYDFSYTRRRSSLWACVLSQPQQRQSQQVLSDCCQSVVIFSSLLDKAARKLIKSKCPDARWLKKLNVSLGRYDEFFVRRTFNNRNYFRDKLFVEYFGKGWLLFNKFSCLSPWGFIKRRRMPSSYHFEIADHSNYELITKSTC